MKTLVTSLLVMVDVAAANAQERLPIIDMHLHAHGADHQGPPPLGICAPFTQFPGWDPVRPWKEMFMELQIRSDDMAGSH